MGVSSQPLIISTKKGLYCPQGDFYIDPWQAVEKAVITHAHSDHARAGSKKYLTASDGLHVLRARIGKKAQIETMPYRQSVTISGVKVSLHSAGHVLGSSQVRVEHQGRVWVVSGDYKTTPDATCAPFEVLRCDTFITESTFGLPIYRWPDPRKVQEELNSWWGKNKSDKRTSILYAYSFGKAQRLLSLLDSSIGPIYVHPAIAKMNEQYATSGVKLPVCKSAEVLDDSDSKDNLRIQFPDFAGNDLGSAMIVTPPMTDSAWMRSVKNSACGFVSGWMQIRNKREEQIHDKSFVLSDHADWDELLTVIKGTGAEEVVVTHGYVQPLTRYLNEIGVKARSFRTPYSGEADSGENK